MSNSNAATLTFRIMPVLKEALCVSATCEHQSIANMVEVLIRGYFLQNDIDVPEGVKKPERNLNDVGSCSA